MGCFWWWNAWTWEAIGEELLPGLNHIYTALVVVVGWVFFRADTLADAKVILHQMFTWENGIYPASLFVNRKVIFLAVLGVLLFGHRAEYMPEAAGAFV